MTPVNTCQDSDTLSPLFFLRRHIFVHICPHTIHGMGEEAPSTPPEVKLSAIKAIGGLVPQKTQAQESQSTPRK